jgi:hypothetical protein
MKYVGVNLTKFIQYLDEESKIKPTDKSKMTQINVRNSTLILRRLNIIDSVLSTMICGSNIIPIKISDSYC